LLFCSIVLSLLLSAGMIVFVNRQENFKATNAVLTKKAADAETRASLRTSEAESKRLRSWALGAALTSPINSLKTELAAAQGTITAKDGPDQ